MATVEVDTGLLEDVVTFAQKVAAIQEKEAQASQDVSAEAKTVLGMLKDAGLCDPSAKDEQLLEKLSDHAEALRTLGRLAKLVPPPSMGAPAEKTAEESQPGEKESDRVFLDRLGL